MQAIVPASCAEFLSPVRLHPHSACTIPDTISLSATWRWERDDLLLHYRLEAPKTQVIFPAALPPGPADNLWQHTCFEAFVARPDDVAYCEFNFSPSRQWAAYRFSRYRERIDSEPAVTHPAAIGRHDSDDEYVLEARIPAALLPHSPDLEFGLTAVIESPSGTLSYWALTHVGPRPDFHLRASFTLALHRPTP